MITYSEASARVARSRSGYAKLGSNTYVHATCGNAFAVRYHSTDVVTIHDDGTYSLSTGGWETVTTARRLNDYSPARVSSVKGQWVIWSANDPRTPPKIQKCRICHGTGELHSQAYSQTHGTLPRNTYEVTTDYIWNRERNGRTFASLWDESDRVELLRDGRPVTGQPRDIRLVGQVVRHDRGSYGRLPEPVWHPSVASECWHCHGTRVYDYGSKPRPVIFHDGITVDSHGEVTDPDAERPYPTPEEIAAKAAKAAKDARLYARRNRARLARERTDWVASYGLTVTDSRRDGRITVYKAVGEDLTSVNAAPGASHGFPYPIGTTVTAPDWLPTPHCGGGLHFGPSPAVAQSYYRDATRFLACSVLVRGMQVIGDKIKVQSARVLYEVDFDGNRI